MSLENKETDTTNTININRMLLTEPKSIADAFNNYFISVAPAIQGKISHAH